MAEQLMRRRGTRRHGKRQQPPQLARLPFAIALALAMVPQHRRNPDTAKDSHGR